MQCGLDEGLWVYQYVRDEANMNQISIKWSNELTRPKLIHQNFEWVGTGLNITGHRACKFHVSGRLILFTDLRPQLMSESYKMIKISFKNSLSGFPFGLYELYLVHLKLEWERYSVTTILYGLSNHGAMQYSVAQSHGFSSGCFHKPASPTHIDCTGLCVMISSTAHSLKPWCQ